MKSSSLLLTFLFRLAARLFLLAFALMLLAFAVGEILSDDIVSFMSINHRGILSFPSHGDSKYAYGIYLMDVQRNFMKQVSFAYTDQESFLSGAWSPDGNQLAYIKFLGDTTDILIAGLFGGTSQTISGYDGVYGLSWSPDGRQLALDATGGGGATPNLIGVITMTLADGETHQIFAADTPYPLWTPQQQILFVDFPGHANSQIIITDRDAQTTHPITSDHLTKLDYPALSPDGQQIIFPAYDPDDPTNSVDLYVVDLKDGRPRLLTGEMQRGSFNASASWSPDGRQLAFVSVPAVETRPDNRFPAVEAHSDIYVMDADGTHPHPITFNNLRNFNPVWSPDGKQILFQQMDDYNISSIYLVDADGQNLRLLATFAQGASWKP